MSGLGLGSQGPPARFLHVDRWKDGVDIAGEPVHLSTSGGQHPRQGLLSSGYSGPLNEGRIHFDTDGWTGCLQDRLRWLA